ncbi:MAG: hypothetical protein NTZ56_09890 [Acidobacteria bacterium]|nr:hypothetical protein [Acidobacteriota bacterium]
MEDPIVEEIRRYREEHAARFNYDLDLIFADFKRLEAERNWPRVSRSPKRIAPVQPAEPLPLAKAG